MRLKLQVLAILGALGLLLGAGMAHGQASRYESNIYTINSSAPLPGGLYPVLAYPGATIAVCNAPANAVPCTNYATTYNNAAESSNCTAPTQLTRDDSTTCVGPADAEGGFGVWIAAGTYQYTVVTAYGNFGPYDFSVGGGGSGGGGSDGPNGYIPVWSGGTGNGAVSGLVFALPYTVESSTCPTAFTFTGGGGTGAAATPICGGAQGDTIEMLGYTLTAPGLGYTSAPTVGLLCGTSGACTAGPITALIASSSSFGPSPLSVSVPGPDGVVDSSDALYINNTVTAANFVDNGIGSGYMMNVAGSNFYTVTTIPYTAVSGTQSTSPLCPNGTNGGLTTAGCTATAAGAVLLAPAAGVSQTVTQQAGTSFGIDGTYIATTYGSSGVTNSLDYTANGSPQMFANNETCAGQGYNLGNNGTSAEGWSTCAMSVNTFHSAVRGIDQMYTAEFTKDSQGDMSANYVYMTPFGGRVDSSGEGIENDVLQTHQNGYYTALASNGFAGSTHVYGNIASGVTWISDYDVIPVSGPLATITLNFYSGAAAPTAGVVDVVIATNNGNNSYTITNIIPITIAATAAPQTFASGTGFTPTNVLVGQVVGLYIPSGIGPASDSIAQIYLSGPPSTGTATYNNPGGGQGLSISTTMGNPTTGTNNLVTTDFTCNGYCQAQAGQSFADGGMMLDTTKGGATATIGSYARDATNGAMTYALASGTVAVSTAWGSIVPSSCTPNGNGQYQAYTSTTCNITLGTSPASPGNFASGTDICLAGPFQEEAAVTAVGTPSAGVQSVTFSTRYAYNAQTTFVMQGGICGQAFVATSSASSWPVAYAVVGATSATQMYFSNCVVGACNGSGSTGNIIPAPLSATGGQITRASDVVTLTGSGWWTYGATVGSSIVVSGYTPSDLNGTFTVVSNTFDTNNQAVTWAQTAANETSTASGAVSQAPTGITFYPMAFITGSNGGASGTAQLATNTVPWALNDSVFGAPTSEFSSAGFVLQMGQTTPLDGGYGSEGFAVNDNGPAPMTWDYFAGNNPADGPSSAMFEVQGSYFHVWNLGYRPANNGAVIYVQGGEPVSSNQKPYYLFQDNESQLAIGVNPATDTFTFGNQASSTVVMGNIQATVAASAFAAGTTVGGVPPCLQSGTNCPSAGGLPAGTTGQGLYYAANGTTATATSDITHTGATAGSPVGIDNATPLATLDLGTGATTWQTQGGPTTNTTLSGALTSTATAATVASTTGYPTQGYLLLGVGATGCYTPEIVSYTSTTSTTFAGLTRGIGNSGTGSAHASGCPVALIESGVIAPANTSYPVVWASLWQGTSYAQVTVGEMTSVANYGDLIANNLVAATNVTVGNGNGSISTNYSIPSVILQSVTVDGAGFESSASSSIAVTAATTTLAPTTSHVILTGIAPTALATITAPSSTDCTLAAGLCDVYLTGVGLTTTTTGNINNVVSGSGGLIVCEYIQANAKWYCQPSTAVIANVQVTLPTSAIAATTCTTPATVTMTGVTTSSTFTTAFATNPNAVTGWGASGGLSFTSWPTANTLNWSVCNQTAASITPGTITLNVGAK